MHGKIYVILWHNLKFSTRGDFLNSNSAIYMGVTVGLCIFIILAVALWLYKIQHCGEYDERQQIARGKAFQNAFFTIVGFELLRVIAEQVMERRLFDSSTSAFVAVLLGVMVFAVVCILNDAYVSFSKKGNKEYIILAVGVLLNWLIAIRLLIHGGLTKITDAGLRINGNFLIAVMGTVIITAALCKKWINRRPD